MRRKLPNIVITGTPTVGKTTTCTQLISLASDLPGSAQGGSGTEAGPGPGPEAIKLRYLSINDLVKEQGCHEGWDEEVKSWIVDEEAVGDEVEKILGVGGAGAGNGHGHRGGGEESEEEEEEEGGWLIDWHACDLFPRSWVDLVVVLRCQRTEVMWDRLKARYVCIPFDSAALCRVYAVYSDVDRFNSLCRGRGLRTY